jgi:hypothetical protein
MSCLPCPCRVGRARRSLLDGSPRAQYFGDGIEDLVAVSKREAAVEFLMQPRWLRLSLTTAWTVALATCGPDIAYYTSPPGLTPKNAVTVVGSKDPKSLLEASEFHYVSAIDGKPVEDAEYHWDRPLLITAGEPHHIRLGYSWGTVEGKAEVEFTGQPGTTLVVRGENVDPDREARLRLEDRATGRTLGREQTVRLAYRPKRGAYRPGI